MAPSELSAFPGNEKVFIDSNILTYHLLNDPVYGERCKAIKDYSLLTNDAFHVATMKRQGITNIATTTPTLGEWSGSRYGNRKEERTLRIACGARGDHESHCKPLLAPFSV